MEKAKQNLKEIILEDVKKVYSKIPYKTKNCFHWYLQYYLKFIAERHELKGEIEYPVKDIECLKKENGENRNGFIDISWHNKKTGDPIVLIEIDSGFRKKSVYKLKTAKSTFKVWVYYGKEISEERKAFIEENDKEKEIIFIHIPLNLSKNTSLGIKHEDYLTDLEQNVKRLITEEV